MDEGLRSELSKQGVFTTTLEELYNWGRKNSIWPLGFGLACCAIEMIAASMARYDLARFGAEVFRPSPRQADLMIVAGTVTKKMAPQVVRLYNQMPEPKYVIAMGACAISGGPFKQGYNVLKGIDRYIPVDVHIPGCPPRPEALLHAFMTLQRKIDEQALTGAQRPRHLVAEAPSEFPVPEYGEHDLEPPSNPAVWQPPTTGARENSRRGALWKRWNKSKPAWKPRCRGRRVEIVPNDSPAGQRSLLVDNAHALAVARFLRDDPALRLDYASNVTGVDWLDTVVQEKRKVKQVIEGVEREIEETIEHKKAGYLEVVYHLYSMELKHGPVILRLRTANRTDNARVPSLTPVWRGAEFQEREAYDLYGIIFDGHPDLRRILMWDEFKDFPMRKDYVEPDDYEYEPTPHDEVLEKAQRHYPG